MAEQQKKGQEQDVNQLRKVRREKLADLQANGKDPFVITKYNQTHHSQEIKDNFEELEGKEVSIAGRMMSKRVMGKASSVMYRICRKYPVLRGKRQHRRRSIQRLQETGCR